MIHDEQTKLDLELIEKHPELKDRDYINSLLNSKKEKSSSVSLKKKFQSAVHKVGKTQLTRMDE